MRAVVVQAIPVNHESVILDLKAVRPGYFALPMLDGLVEELLDAAALVADDVIVVTPSIELEYRLVALEMQARNQSGRLKLGQHPVHGRQPDFLAGVEQITVDGLCGEVSRLRPLQDFQDLHAGQRDLETGFFQILGFQGNSFAALAVLPRSCCTRADCCTIGRDDRIRFLGCTRLMFKILISIVATASLLSACSGIAYRLDVQQGNAIADEQVMQLRPGMTPQQVEFLLGSPQVRGAFLREDRWDYVYYNRPGRGATELRRVSVFFEAGRVSRVEDSAAR